MAYKLEKPYTDIQRADFIVNYNHKQGFKIEETDNALYALLANEIMQNGVPIINENYALEAAQQAAPELPRGLLLDEWRDDWRELTARLGCVSIHLNHKLLNKARVMQLKDAGLRILVYTVNKPQRAAELLRWGVDCICTDAIDVIGPNFTAQ